MTSLSLITFTNQTAKSTRTIQDSLKWISLAEVSIFVSILELIGGHTLTNHLQKKQKKQTKKKQVIQHKVNTHMTTHPGDHTHLEKLQEEQDVDPDEMEETHDHDESHPGVTSDVVVHLRQEVARLGRMQDKLV